MAFLDNSGDIILDAVLTDTGRFRLARGDGSFKITKFALGDDEIDYSLYDKNHPSGSAYYDLDILQTPVLEANTDNAAGLKSRLISINQTDLLYLPVIKLSEYDNSISYNNEKYFIVAVDETTADLSAFKNGDGVANGVFITHNQSKNLKHIEVHQGIDNTAISSLNRLAGELTETVYIVEMDNRLGVLLDMSNNNSVELTPSYIDDDQIATYILTKTRNSSHIKDIQLKNADGSSGEFTSIAGPPGTKLMLRLKAKEELQVSKYLFEQIGSTIASPSVNIIDTNLRVIGGTTGYRLDIPIRYVKQ